MQKHQERIDASDDPKRRPYEPPRVLESGEFETLALACGKLPPPASFACAVDPSQS